MDAFSGVSVEGVVKEPTVGSILGIRGPLRFRTHGSTQKAHVVLRRIESSEESGDEEEGASMVYFSLFAQKRIEVKPGKEILLAVASPDGRYIDTPVIFAGSLVEKEPIEKKDPPPTPPPPPQPLPVVEELSPKPPPVYTVPPRMRKAWPGGSADEFGSDAFQFPPSKSISYSSVGVQCEISTTERAVETDPEPVKPVASTGVQAEEPPKVTHARDVQTETPIISYKDGEVQTIVEVPPPPPVIPAATEPQKSAEGKNKEAAPVERERSLSPMELDSPPSSPTLSPVNAPTKPSTPSGKKADSSSSSPQAYSPPDLALSTSEASQASSTEVRISPLHLSPDSGDAPGLLVPSDTPTQKQHTPAAGLARPQSSPQGEKPKVPLPPSTTPPITHQSFASLSLPPSASPSLPAPATPTIIAQELTRQPSDHAPYVPTRKAVPNPFVSGGYINDFVTPSAQAAAISRLAEPSQQDLKSELETPILPPDVKCSSLPEIASTATPMPSSVSPPPPPAPVARTKPDSPISSAASTSRVKVEDLPLNGVSEGSEQSLSRYSSAEYDPSPTAPKARAAAPQHPSVPHQYQSGSPYPLYPPRGPANAIPPVRALHPSLTAQFPAALHPWARSRERSPPPDVGSLAYIPSGSFHNPLNIRPAPAPSRPAPPTAPAASSVPPATPSSTPPKKPPVMVGNGWPYNTRSATRAAAAAAAKSIPTQPAKMKNSNYNNNNDDATPPTTPAPPTPAPPPMSYPQPPTAPRSLAMAAAGWGPNVKGTPPTGPAMRSTNNNNHTHMNMSNREPYSQISPPTGPSHAITRSAAKAAAAAPVKNQPTDKGGEWEWERERRGSPQTAPAHDVRNVAPSAPASATPQKGSQSSSTPGNSNSRLSLSGVTSYQSIYSSTPTEPSPRSQSTTSSGPTITPVPPPQHPLPPKPPAFTGNAAGSYSPRRGVKRMVSPTAIAPDHASSHKGGFAWATGEPVHTVRIKGDDDVGVRSITFNSDGTQFAVACFDKSVRIWNCRTRQEIAKLAHTMQVIAVAWMDHDSGVITLGDNGILSTWTRNAQNKWQWAKLLDTSVGRQARESPSCLAFVRDRIAIALPTEGVKVWMFMKGTWLPQRSIGRQKVTAIRFVDDGEALVGGTEDGTLWHCEVPNGTLKALKIFTRTPISTLDTDSLGEHGLIALADGRCELVNIRPDNRKGSVEQIYSVKDMDMPGSVSYAFGAMLINRGQAVLYGSVRGCVMVWDRNGGDVLYGLRHANEDDVIQTVSCFNGNPNLAGIILTGTKTGQLTWFAQPPTDAGPQTRKRSKIS